MALSNAERQRRYRARVKDAKTPVRYRRPKDNRSRARRWRDAVVTLLELQDHYRERLDNLPENLLDTAWGEKLTAIAELDLDMLEAIDPPLGYGRD